MRRSQLRQQDEEDIEEEEHVARDAEQTRQVRDPLHPALQPQGALNGFLFCLFNLKPKPFITLTWSEGCAQHIWSWL